MESSKSIRTSSTILALLSGIGSFVLGLICLQALDNLVLMIAIFFVGGLYSYTMYVLMQGFADLIDNSHIIATKTGNNVRTEEKELIKDTVVEENLKEVKEEKSYSIQYTNVINPFIINRAIIKKNKNGLTIQLVIIAESDVIIQGIEASIILNNIFWDEEKIEKVCFVGFSSSGKRQFVSKDISISPSAMMADTLYTVDVVVEKYICNNQVLKAKNQLIDTSKVEIALLNEDTGKTNFEILEDISALNSANEIRSYMIEFNKENPGFFSEEIINKMARRHTDIERAYGVDMESNIKAVKEYLE